MLICPELFVNEVPCVYYCKKAEIFLIRQDGQSFFGPLLFLGSFCHGQYIKEFVTCGMCKSGNTTLERDQSSRLYMVTLDEMKDTKTNSEFFQSMGTK